MNKWSKLTVAITMAIGAAALYGFTIQPYVERYMGAGAGSTEIIYSLDGSGNVVIDGGVTINGRVASTVDGSFSANGVIPVTLWTPLAALDKTPSQFNNLAPTAAAQLISCSTCKLSRVCMSSGTAAGAWIVAIETGTMATPTHCS